MAGHRPFLKWPGNKFRVLSQIRDVLPTDAKRLIEPFAGSGAVFLNTEYPRYLIAETNPDLINLFICVQQEGTEFIEFSKQFFVPKNNQAEQYYDLRDRFNAASDQRLRSALFIYLNKHGYNGLCRYNSEGIYNVPFGQRPYPGFPEAALKHFYQKAQHAKFLCQDFLLTMQQAKKGDVVYCDPPYVPLTDTAKFTNYHSHGFGMEQQQALAEAAEKLAAAGVCVIISNHDTPVTRVLYKQAEQYYFKVPRYISCNSSTRKPAREILAVFNTQ